MKDHPIRRADVQAAVEAWTKLVLADSGTGKIIVEFDFKEWACESFRPYAEGRRVRLDNGA